MTEEADYSYHRLFLMVMLLTGAVIMLSIILFLQIAGIFG